MKIRLKIWKETNKLKTNNDERHIPVYVPFHDVFENKEGNSLYTCRLNRTWRDTRHRNMGSASVQWYLVARLRSSPHDASPPQKLLNTEEYPSLQKRSTDTVRIHHNVQINFWPIRANAYSVVEELRDAVTKAARLQTCSKKWMRGQKRVKEKVWVQI